MDDLVAEMNHYVTSASTLSCSYSRSDGGTSGYTRTPDLSHAQARKAGEAAAAALGLTQTDVLAYTAPIHTPFGFAAGVLAPLVALSKTGAVAAYALSQRFMGHVVRVQWCHAGNSAQNKR